VIALDLGASGEAIAQFSAAHDIARRLGSATWTRWTGASLAIALARAGQSDQATAVLDAVDHTLPQSTARGELRTLGERFMGMARAEIALATGNPAEALDIIGEAESNGAPRVGLMRAEALVLLERWDEAAKTLDSARTEVVRQGARALLWRIEATCGAVHLGQRHRLDARRSFDAARSAAEEIMSELEPAFEASFRSSVDRLAPPPPERTAGQAARDAHGGLTRRERDTAALVAQGKSNRAIARQLGIGERTVEGYVASVLAKLGFTSRAQIAVWADKQLKHP
jgi:non-specific serine/threonine protein kinase